MCKGLGTIAALAVALSVASGALAASRTVPPARSERAAITKAFGDPGAPARCLPVSLAAADHAYATVRFHNARGCMRWAFNGVNIIHRQPSGRWKVLFEASSYSCPRPRVPRQVQRDLGICP